MKSLFKPHHKLTKREKMTLSMAVILLGLFLLGILDIFGTSQKNKQLKDANSQLEQKVASLQADLARLSKEVSDSKNEVTGQDTQQPVPAQKLSTLSLVASPSDFKFDVDVPEGWQLASENRIQKQSATISVQSEDIDMLTLDNYKNSKLLDAYTLASGKAIYLIFIPTGSESQTTGYLSVSFCNPDLAPTCSYQDEDGKFVFILAHAYQEGDQFARDMDFSSPEGNMLLADFKTIIKSLNL